MSATKTSGVTAPDLDTAPVSPGRRSGRTSPAWGEPAYRLRDLNRNRRLSAAVLLAFLLVPAALALARALGDGWILSGDEASIAVRALDVFSRHPPLTGLPSTSALYGQRIATNHPGPLEFYLLAVPLRVLGATVGPLLTALVINMGAVLIAVWVCFRRLGYVAMLWAGVLAAAFMWSTGTVVLTDTLSSTMTTYSLLATVLLAWAVLDGDARLLPLAAFVASYAAQQHLANSIIVALLGLFTVVGVVAIARSRRLNGAPPTGLPWRRESLIALGVFGVCWLPVLIDEVSGHPGNLTAIIRFARDGKRPTLGPKLGFFQALQAIGPPGVLGRSISTGHAFLVSPGLAMTVLGVAVFGALACVVWLERRRSPSLSRLALVALVVLVAGVVNGGNVPRSFETVRVNLFRWTWSAAFVTWMAIGVAAVSIARRLPALVARVRRAPPAVGAVALLSATALITAAIAFVPVQSSHNREAPAFHAEKAINAAVIDHLHTHRPVYVEMSGNASLSVGSALVFRLLQTGHRVEVGSFFVPAYGAWTAYRPRSKPVTILVQTGKAEHPSGPGTLLAWQPLGSPFDTAFRSVAARRSALIAALAAQARGRRVVLSPAESARLATGPSSLTNLGLRVLLNNLGTDPARALRSPDLLRIVLDGGMLSPVLDTAQVQELLDLPSTQTVAAFGGDEQAQVHVIDSPASGG